MKKHLNKYKKDNADDIVRFIPEAELDFHNFGPMTSFDIEKILSEFLEDCYMQRLKQVIVITGKGEVVRPAVLKLLARNVHVESFKTAGYFTGQSGAFEVHLKSFLN